MKIIWISLIFLIMACNNDEQAKSAEVIKPKATSVTTAPADTKPWLGVLFERIPKGWLVEKVYPGSGAVEAGISYKDTLLSIAAKPLDKTFRKLPGNAGDSLAIVLLRGQDTLHVQVLLKTIPEYLKDRQSGLEGVKLDLKGRFYANEKAYNDKAKLTLVDFWATWCGPCKKTSPILDRLFQSKKEKGFQVVGLSTESIPLLQRFQKSHPVSFPMLHDIGGKLSSRLGVSSIPTLVLLDEKGFIVKVIKGVPNETRLSRWIDSYLN